ncbi:MAG TPA: ABC transporter permease [Acidimicrobiales bacterium]|nr:ABC transporter permease [Acidimicrobiales bacterium]
MPEPLSDNVPSSERATLTHDAAGLAIDQPLPYEGSPVGPAALPAEAAVVADAADAPVKKKLGVMFWISASWVGLVIVLAIVANLLPVPNPAEVGVALPGLGPSLHHLLGTDELGRDMLSRVIFGARVSLIVGFASIAFGMLVGGSLGMIAGFFRGRFDLVITGTASILLAFPALIFALAIVTFLGPSLSHVTLAIGILAIAPLTLVVRGSTIVYAQREFVVAARMLGAKSGRIIFKEIFANVLPAALSLGLVGIATAIVAEGGLSFLGLSVRPPTPTWGGMIAEGRVVLQQHPMVALWPSIAMFLTVLALNFVGDRLRSYFDVKEGGL